MIVTVQPLVPLHAVFQLELQFGVVRRELQADFVHEFRCQSQMGPSLEELVLLVLELVLSAFVKLHHRRSHIRWIALVPAVLHDLLVKIVSQECERLRCRWCRNLPNEIVSELVLDPRLLQENRLWADVEHSAVLLA